MKNLFIFCFFVMALIFVQFAQGQSVDEIIQKNMEAMGGKEKLATLKTVKLEGSMSIQGTDVSITTTKSHMAGIRTDIEVMGMANYQVANPTKGSVFMPVRGMTAPEDMEAEQYKSSLNQMDLQGPFLNYKDKGTKVEYVGTEKAGDADVYNLKVTFKNGKVNNYFIDTKTNRIVKTTGKSMMNGQEMDVQTTYSDYKQTSDGFWFPFTVTNTQGTINYSKISTNVPVDISIFKI
ncbi:MAG: hypothetical protein ABIO04_02495 [Ferruginibacter sp.]